MTAPQLPSANPVDLHVDDGASRRNKKTMTKEMRQTLSMFPPHLPRPVRKMQGQRDVVAESRRKTRQHDLVVVNLEPKMRRNRCPLDD